jgi:hypothetical protein
MRKPRDLDAELEALNQRAKTLKTRRVTQFGELVVATGADALDLEVLAGVLLSAANGSAAERASWKAAGATFFREGRRSASDGGRRQASSGRASAGSHANSGTSA